MKERHLRTNCFLCKCSLRCDHHNLGVSTYKKYGRSLNRPHCLAKAVTFREMCCWIESHWHRRPSLCSNLPEHKDHNFFSQEIFVESFSHTSLESSSLWTLSVSLSAGRHRESQVIHRGFPVTLWNLNCFTKHCDSLIIHSLSNTFLFPQSFVRMIPWTKTSSGSVIAGFTRGNKQKSERSVVVCAVCV